MNCFEHIAVLCQTRYKTTDVQFHQKRFLRLGNSGENRRSLSLTVRTEQNNMECL